MRNHTNMDIIKEFQKYPKAWDAFLEWCLDGNTLISWHSADINLRDEDYNSDETQRYLLADVQAWLRSIGAHVVVIPTITDYWTFKLIALSNIEVLPYKNVDANDYRDHDKALIAAELKGCEIFENSKTK